MIENTIAVIGLGLIGGSIARRLTKEGMRVLGVDIDKNTCIEAERAGAIEQGFVNAKEAISQADITILSIYPDDALDFVLKYNNDFKKGCILTDVVGIKRPLMELCNKTKTNFTYIGGHPMAGKEVSGFSHATQDLFEGANFIITPSMNATKEQIDYIKHMAKLLGCINFVVTTPKLHDEIIAYTSQLPHIIAVSMCDTPLLLKHKNFTGGSFEDVTRVAKINEELWSQLFLQNKNNLLNIIDDFEKSINDIKTALEKDDEKELKRIFKKVRKDKELIEGENTKS